MKAENAESIAKENLKTLRLLHQILMVVSAVVIAFSLRPDRSKSYSDALKELSSLQGVKFVEWGAFVQNRYGRDQIANTQLVRKASHLAGVKIEGSAIVSQPVYCEMPLMQPGLARLKDIDLFLNSERHIGGVKLTVAREDLAAKIKLAVSTRNSDPIISGMSLEQFPATMGSQTNGVRTLDWINPPLVLTASLMLIVNDHPQTIPNAALPVPGLTYKIDDETGKFPLEWIRHDQFGKSLVDDKTNEVFPHLKVFWDKVQNLDTDGATTFLTTQAEAEKRGTVSFVGISIESSLIIIAGPLASLLVLLFISLHERHSYQVSIDHETLRTYPWVPLFQGIWGNLVSYFSLLFLPLGANVWLLLKFGVKTNSDAKIGWIICALILPTALWSLYELRRLRKLCRKPHRHTPAGRGE